MAEFNIKSYKITNVINACRRIRETGEVPAGFEKDLEKTIVNIWGGYLSTVEEEAESVNTQLNLDYDTIKNLMSVITVLAIHQNEYGYDMDRNMRVTARTLAAYLNILAMNCHNMTVDVTGYSNKKHETRPALWADFMQVRLNKKRDSDMLPAVIASLSYGPIQVEKGFIIDSTPIVERYLRVTGVNLLDYGFANILIQL